MAKLLSKAVCLNFIVSTLILVVLCLILGLEIIVFIFPLILYGIKLILDEQYPKHKTTLAFIAFFALGFSLPASKFLINHIFIEQQTETCGTLAKNDDFFFYGAFFNKPNIVINDGNILKEFSAKFYDITLNSKVCITYIESDNTIWFFNDYVLDITEIKN